MLTRERLGYAPGMMDSVYLCQDLDALDAALQSSGADPRDLLLQADEIEAEARRLRVPDLISKGLIQRSKILLAGGQCADAVAALRTAEQALGQLRQDDLKVAILGGLAEAHARLGQWETVAKICEEGIRLVEVYRREVSGQYLQSSYLRSRIHLYAYGVRAAFEEGQYETMLRWAELSKCRSVLQIGRRSASPSEEETQTRERFLAVCRQVEEARQQGGADTLEKLCMQRRTLWDLLLIQRAEGGREADVPEFRLPDLQSLLAPDEAVLYYYWVDPQTLLVAAVACDGLRVELQPAAEQREQLKRFSAGILEDLVPGAPEWTGHIDQGNRFADLLLPHGIVEFLDAQGRQRRRLLISPHRELHALPFHALPWDAGDAGDHYLIQRFAVTYVPNLTCLLTSYRTPARRRLLALGICDYNLAGEDLPPLEDAELEAVEVADLYRQKGHEETVWWGQDANETNLRQLAQAGQLGSFTTLHIATHGRSVDSDTPMESCLYLYDSRLEGLEIADWQLGAELVVLSACCSGQRAIKGRGLDELPGDDLFGLQAAFFAAGAKWVLGSLWPVHSQTTRQIMTRFQAFLLTGQTPDVALQSAVREHLDTAGPRLRESLYWAPFFLSAVGRPARSGLSCPA